MHFSPCRMHSIVVVAALLSACAGGTAPRISPPGADESAGTSSLKMGAALLQSQAPLRPMDVYLVGFHAARDNPDLQMETHHYCASVNEEFMQCTLFDGNSGSANLVGIEYIISEKLFRTLPLKERRYWHPHNYEILSGQLAAPGIPGPAEHELMRRKMNSYGKTWHVWNSAPHGHIGDRMPLGDAMLEWSFNRDGEAQPGLVEDRDRRMGISTAEKRRERANLVPLAKPQAGVNVLKGAFKRRTIPLPGVVDETR